MKTLLKKQFQEMTRVFVFNPRTGKARSKLGTLGYISIFATLFITMAFVFLMIAIELADALINGAFMAGNSLEWIYFAMLGTMTLFSATFLGLFNAYASIYNAKDNELLLSLPVKASDILISRLLSVFAFTLLYSSIVWVPTCVAYCFMKLPTEAMLISWLVMLILIALFATVLSCVFGYVVANVQSRVKHKNVIVVVLSIVLFAAYYYVCFQLQNMIESLVTNVVIFGQAVEKWAYPILLLGQSGTGNLLSLLIITVCVLAACALCIYVLNLNFTKILTRTSGTTKKEYNEDKVKVTSVKRALLKRELQNIGNSPSVMMNCGLGIVILPVLCIVICLKMDSINEVLEVLNVSNDMFIVGLASMISMIITMDAFSASSVSLEGKSIWITKSLPVKTLDILQSKERLHELLNGICVIVCAMILSFGLHLRVIDELMLILFGLMSVCLSAIAGLSLNLLMPNLHWTNPTAVVKQGLPVMFVLFGGWIVSGLVFGLYLIKFSNFGSSYYLLLVTVIFGIIYLALYYWLKTKGVKLYERL